MNGGASQYNRKYKINSKEFNPNEPDEQQTIPDHMFQVGTVIIINNAEHEYNEMTGQISEVHPETNRYTVYLNYPIDDEIEIGHNSLLLDVTGGSNKRITHKKKHKKKRTYKKRTYKKRTYKKRTYKKRHKMKGGMMSVASYYDPMEFIKMINMKDIEKKFKERLNLKRLYMDKKRFKKPLETIKELSNELDSKKNKTSKKSKKGKKNKTSKHSQHNKNNHSQYNKSKHSKK